MDGGRRTTDTLTAAGSNQDNILPMRDPAQRFPMSADYFTSVSLDSIHAT